MYVSPWLPAAASPAQIQGREFPHTSLVDNVSTIDHLTGGFFTDLDFVGYPPNGGTNAHKRGVKNSHHLVLSWICSFGMGRRKNCVFTDIVYLYFFTS